MTPEQWREIKDVLGRALELDPDQRSGYLDTLCAGNADMRSELDSLLRSYEEDSSFLSVPAAEVLVPPANIDTASRLIGSRFGAYELLGVIAEGGMGTVYRAERADGLYENQVAIKIIRAELAGQFFVSRFDTERRILARLDHPNIARLLDGGITSDGLPFLVLEYVDGIPIDRYCRGQGLSVPQTLTLFRTVCAAVQYAHQNLVVHRDLKPANILVTSEGVPKLLDFGVAKVLDPEPDEAMGATTVAMLRILTPDFASPEQVRGEPVTIASDVYSLGVILYLLLTGEHPYRVPRTGTQSVVDTVCRVIPKRPSAIVVETGGTEESAEDSSRLSRVRLARTLRGDLDCILLKALRKEPDQRYPTVAEFSEDIGRYLGRAPVKARKGTNAYRLSRLLARNRGVFTGAAILLVVVATSIGMILREGYLAQRRFNDLRRLANSLIFEIHDSVKGLPGSTPARKLIIDRALEYLDGLSTQSRGDLSLQRELATAYERVGLVQGQFLETSLGDTKGCLASYEKAFAIRKRIADRTGDNADRLALARAFRLVGTQQWALGQYQLAIKNASSALAISEDLNRSRSNDWEMLSELRRDYDFAGMAQRRGYDGGIGDPLKAKGYFNKAGDVSESMLRLRPEDPETLEAYQIDLYHRGEAIRGQDPGAAIELFEKELSIGQKLMQLSPDVRYARMTARSYTDLSMTFEGMGDYLHMLENSMRGLVLYKKILATDPQNSLLKRGTAVAYINTATAYRRVGHKMESAEYSRLALEIMRELARSDSSNRQNQGLMAAVAVAAAYNFMGTGNPDEAMEEFEEGCAIYKSLVISPSPDPSGPAKMAYCDTGMGDAARTVGNRDEAERFYSQAIARGGCLDSNAPDAQLCIAAAHAYEGIGDLDRKPTGKKSDAGCRQTREWYQKSIAAWDRAPHPDAVDKYSFEMGSAGDVKKKLQACGP
jgi:tetratricopeptide (TPR) repeat protein